MTAVDWVTWANNYLDPVQYILGKDNESPVQIEADTQPQHHDAVLPWREIRMKYADGTQIILDGENRYKEAAFIEGPNGKLFKGFKSDIPDLEKRLAEFPEPEPQVTDFIEAVKERKKFALNEVNGHRSCTIVNLAKIALRTRRRLKFDSDFINDDEANGYIKQPMRGPWKVTTKPTLPVATVFVRCLIIKISNCSRFGICGVTSMY